MSEEEIFKLEDLGSPFDLSSTKFYKTYTSELKGGDERIPADLVKVQRISVCSLQPSSDSELIGSYNSSIVYWSRVTHVIFECLCVDHKGKVGIFDTGRPTKSPVTYVAEMAKLRRTYPHIKIVLGFFTPFRKLGAEEMFKNPKNFFDTSFFLLAKYGFHGMEFDFSNFSSYPQSSAGIAYMLCSYPFRGNCFFRLGSSLDFSLFETPMITHLFAELSGYLIVDTSGLYETSVFHTDHGYKSQILASTQCSLNKTKDVVTNLIKYLPPYKILLGISTSAVLFKAEGIGKVAVDIREVTYSSAFRTFMSTQSLENPFIVPKKGKEKSIQEIISFDTPGDRIKKLNLIKDLGLGGCVIDDLDSDFPLAHENCAANMAVYKLC